MLSRIRKNTWRLSQYEENKDLDKVSIENSIESIRKSKKLKKEFQQ